MMANESTSNSSAAGLVVTQKLLWGPRVDSASGVSANFDDSQAADVQVHVAKAPIKVGDSFSAQAMARELWFSEAEARTVYAMLGQMFSDLDAHRAATTQS